MQNAPSMDEVAVPSASLETAVAQDVPCPLCEYNLRGLTAPRCPECGYEFAWDEVLDPNRRRHLYLFEHHPDKPVTSLARTLVGGLRPRRFWRTLHPVQPSKPGWLLVYLALVVAIVVFPAVMQVMIGARQSRPMGGWWGNSTLREHFLYPRRFDYFYLVVEPLMKLAAENLVLVATSCLLLLPLLSLGLLQIYQISLGRARLKFHHVARCIVYAYDAAVWLGVSLGVLVIFNATPDIAGSYSEGVAWMCLIGVPLVWMVLAYRLGCAYAHYLRFPHAWMSVGLTQLAILLLAVLISACVPWF